MDDIDVYKSMLLDNLADQLTTDRTEEYRNGIKYAMSEIRRQKEILDKELGKTKPIFDPPV